ncbi:hypothetical protein AVEN_71477-1 [Araneus ventricosus]|uniref:Uncharacterized protein n=1 Tax=Araneus ventricosus TaxID=182803 RepID=A0A4Y2CUJ5_ARAVE|nr:hypothetical protein AVEN_71477-1 [Araneus ventricosus]
MPWQCLFLLCKEDPLWHILPKEASVIVVEDLLRDESCCLYITYRFGHNSFGPILVLTRTLVLCFRKIRSKVTWARQRFPRQTMKTNLMQPMTNFSRKESMITEVNENRDITVFSESISFELYLLPS